MIPLMKNTFHKELETRRALSQFILDAPRLSMDTECFRFETSFAERQGRKDAILFNSGGSANLALLRHSRILVASATTIRSASPP